MPLLKLPSVIRAPFSTVRVVLSPMEMALAPSVASEMCRVLLSSTRMLCEPGSALSHRAWLSGSFAFGSYFMFKSYRLFPVICSLVAPLVPPRKIIPFTTLLEITLLCPLISTLLNPA